jgi:hypothetical protein
MSRQETDSVADSFERQFPQFRPVAFADPLNPKASPAARIQYVPQQHEGAGMFVASWERHEAK